MHWLVANRHAAGRPGLPAESAWRILIRSSEAAVLSRHRLSLIARLLALALLMGQFAAQAHAYSHLSDNPDGLPGTAQGCRACLSFAPLESAVGGSPTVIIVARCEAEAFLPLERIQIAQGPSHRAFQSRAPPAVL